MINILKAERMILISDNYPFPYFLTLSLNFSVFTNALIITIV